MTSVCVLAGGVGAARFGRGLVRAVAPDRVTMVANTADDVVLHGLHICPDLDTITYTLAGEVNPDTGWGLVGESWQAMTMLSEYGGEDWFRLGDRDLGTHLYRTHRLSQGADLATVTAEITGRWGLDITLLPMTNDAVETRVTLADGPEIGFQEYFVGRAHSVPISAVRFVGVESASPAPGVLESVSNADVVIIAPSNPIVSIGPILAVQGLRSALSSRRGDVVAISPIVGGAALKGPADRMLTELGHTSDVAGVAALYRDVAATLVIDTLDAEHAEAIEAIGVEPLVCPTVMTDDGVAADLARRCLGEHR